MIASSTIISWILAHGYSVMFPLMVIEGPIVTIIGSFLASLGYFHITVVYMLAVLGDLVGDSLYYAIGRFGGRPFIERWGHRFGVTQSRMKTMESYFDHHSGKTIVMAKVTHGLGMWVLMCAGAVEVPYWPFLFFNFIGTVPKALVFVVLGYFFGHAYSQIGSTIDLVSFIVVGIFIVLAAIGYMMRDRIKKSFTH